MLYRKSLSVTSAVRSSFGVGAIVNLQSNDASKIWSLPQYLHVVWNGPFQIMVIMGMLVGKGGGAGCACVCGGSCCIRGRLCVCVVRVGWGGGGGRAGGRAVPPPRSANAASVARCSAAPSAAP
jgi:hypothetical protein